MSEKIKEYPILFTAPMVKAVLDDKKTQTRRLVKLKEGETVDTSTCWAVHPTKGWRLLRCPYGPKGTHLWVKEAWKAEACRDDLPPRELTTSLTSLWWLADGGFYGWQGAIPGRYRHARFMPRWASRITLEVTGVKVERLQDISEEDAIAEGVGFGFQMNAGWPDYGNIVNGACELIKGKVIE